MEGVRGREVWRSTIDHSVNILQVRPSRGSSPQTRLSCPFTGHASPPAPSSTSEATTAEERCSEGLGDQSLEPSSESARPPRSTTTTQRPNRRLSTSRSERPVQTGSGLWRRGPLRCSRLNKLTNGSGTARSYNRPRGREGWFGTVLLPLWPPTTLLRMLVRVQLLRGTRPRRVLRGICCSSR